MGGYGGVVLNGEKTKQSRDLNTRVRTDETKSQDENKTGHKAKDNISSCQKQGREDS